MSKSADFDFKDAIALLSNDHDQVLDAFSNYAKLGERAYASKQRYAAEICAALIVHMKIEEEIFYPAVAAASSDGKDLVEEAIVEHASARHLIVQLGRMTSEDEMFDAKIKVLSEQIEHHVQEEEGQLFPEVRKSGLDLVLLGKKMATRKAELTAERV